MDEMLCNNIGWWLKTAYNIIIEEYKINTGLLKMVAKREKVDPLALALVLRNILWSINENIQNSRDRA